MANNKNHKSNVKGDVAAANLLTGGTNGAIVRATITQHTQNGISNSAHLINGNADPNAVTVSGLFNSASPTHTQTQFVKLVGQGIALK